MLDCKSFVDAKCFDIFDLQNHVVCKKRFVFTFQYFNVLNKL